MIADTLRTLSRHVGRGLERARRRLRGQPPGGSQAHADRALARRLRDTFEQDLEIADVGGLHFYVKASAVTIYGTVRHELDRALLLSFIQQRPEVEAVVSHLSIEEPDGAAAQVASPTPAQA